MIIIEKKGNLFKYIVRVYMPKNPVVEPKMRQVKKKQTKPVISSNKRTKPDLIEFDKFPQMKQPTFVRKDKFTGLNIPIFI
jgi:hypothetical protein